VSCKEKHFSNVIEKLDFDGRFLSEMEPYIILLFSIALVLLISRNVVDGPTAFSLKPRNLINPIIYWSLAGTLILFAGLRFDTGTDFRMYQTLFTMVNSHSLLRSIEESPQEVAYVAVQFAVKQVTQDATALFLVTSILTVVPIFFAIRRLVQNVKIGILSYLMSGVFLSSMNATRQGISMAFFTLGVALWKTNSVGRFVALIIAVLFHQSAIIAIILLLVFKIRKPSLSQILITPIAIILLAALLLQVNEIQGLASSLSDRYLTYLVESVGAGIGTWLNVGFWIIVLIVVYLQNADRDELFLSNLQMAVLVPSLMSLSLIVIELGRLSGYFTIFAFVVVSNYLESGIGITRKATFFVAGFAYFLVHIYFYNGLLPYKSLFL
jgi:hypothetical protein